MLISAPVLKTDFSLLLPFSPAATHCNYPLPLSLQLLLALPPSQLQRARHHLHRSDVPSSCVPCTLR
eukprot:NODE_1705_length_782_cov_127.326057_g1426_i0.p4 GENE.NODE_1705_length_782_cov_127.326057_g1426_i0~~NODE_1705_length_782_cov_127.326057_g1426_i0.p4  ORF type:complete len:67 (-),score=11.13 NODE_1705_length_782_cov_127.326057_g1426_i0:5-205(-)